MIGLQRWLRGAGLEEDAAVSPESWWRSPGGGAYAEKGVGLNPAAPIGLTERSPTPTSVPAVPCLVGSCPLCAGGGILLIPTASPYPDLPEAYAPFMLAKSGAQLLICPSDIHFFQGPCSVDSAADSLQMVIVFLTNGAQLESLGIKRVL